MGNLHKISLFNPTPQHNFDLDRSYTSLKSCLTQPLASAGLIHGSSFRPNAFLPPRTASAAPPSSSMKPPSTMLSTVQAGSESPFSCLTMSPPGRLRTKVHLVGVIWQSLQSLCSEQRTIDKMKPGFWLQPSNPPPLPSLLSPRHAPKWQLLVQVEIERNRILFVNDPQIPNSLLTKYHSTGQTQSRVPNHRCPKTWSWHCVCSNILYSQRLRCSSWTVPTGQV